MKERVYKNWKSTLIGFVIIAASITHVLYKGGTWWDNLLPLAIGIGLLLAKDTVIDWIESKLG